MVNEINKLKRYLRNLKNYSGDPLAFIKYALFIFYRIFLKYPHSKKKKENERYDELIFQKKEIKKDVLGIEMVLPTEDKGLSKDLILYGVREKEVRDLLKKLDDEKNPLVTSNSVVIEVGANIGYYALQWAKIINMGEGILYAIEPNPLCFKYLKKNMKLNNFRRIHLINKGISDKKERKFLKLEKEWNLSRVVKDKKKNVKELEFDSLDNLFKGREDISLIRMDIEGYEYNLLKGARDLLKKNKGLKILMEYHPNKLTIPQKKEIIRILKESGFRIKYYTDKKGRIKKGGDISFIKRCIYPLHFLLIKKKNDSKKEN